MKYKVIPIKTVMTPGMGGLSFFEAERDVPFAIARVYFIYGVPMDTQRGAHAHKSLQQLLFCPYGSIRIKLDDGSEKNEVLLDSPDKGLLLEPGLWRDMLWEKADSVLCVAASAYYDEKDYIRDYGVFRDYLTTRQAQIESVSYKQFSGGGA